MQIRKPEPPELRELTGHSETLLSEMYRRMLLIRRFELTVNDLFLRGLMPGTIHLSHGQEATAVGTCLALREDDVITLTHRGHGQALAKGVPPKSLMAELFGKVTGCCQGKGGSLHVGDISHGALPAIAIVGASSPIAAGMAFAFKRQQSGQIACNFMGDGTVNKGDWHEAMNLASVQKTGRLVIVEESNERGGWGAQVAADVAWQALGYLDAPIRRLATPDVPIPFSPILEAAVIPDEESISAAIVELVGEESL
jgi:TPP-dependent pyruvate/acetoin dehydrogenase alpha subunit